MTEKGDRQPVLSAAGRQSASDRQERLAAALRENLRKRKMQQRARAGRAGPSSDAKDRSDPDL